MHRTIITLLLCVPMLANGAGTSQEGRWEGRIAIPGNEVHVVIDLARDKAGVWTGSIIMQGLGIKKIKAPVLVVCGSRDVLYSVYNCTDQASRYTKSRSHKVAIIKGAAHALPIERQAKKFRSRLGGWLKHYGF